MVDLWDVLPFAEDRSLCSHRSSQESLPATAVSFPHLRAGRGFNAAEDVIKIDVGESASAFHVHRSVLCSSSDFFKTRMKPEWSKTGEQHISLPDEKPAAFNLYVNWLYSHNILTTSSEIDDEAAHDEDWTGLASAYVLGEGLMDAAFQDAAMDALRAKVRTIQGPTIWRVACSMVNIIYERTAVRRPARQFMVDIFHHHDTANVLNSTSGDLPSPFLLDLACAFAADRNFTCVTNLDDTQPDPCAYHSHGHP